MAMEIFPGPNLIIPPTSILGGDLYNVKAPPYYAQGDGSTDDTVTVQAAIEDASNAGGGFVIFPMGRYKVNLILRDGVQLVAQRWGHHPNPNAGVYYASLEAVTNAPVVDTPVSNISTIGIIGLNIMGLGAISSQVGVHFRTVRRALIKSCFISNCADQGFLWDNGISINMQDCLIQSCLLNTGRTDLAGALQVGSGATDGYFTNMEATASIFNKTTNENCAAWLVDGGTHMHVNCIAEISDFGFWVQAANSKFVNCRADNNQMDGWSTLGNDNDFVGCHSLSNGRFANNTYDAWRTYGSALGNAFTGCRASSQLSTYRYCYNDTNATYDTRQRNSYVNCTGSSFDTQLTNFANSEFSHFETLGYVLTAIASTTTYDVTRVRVLDFSGLGTPVTVTSFTNGVPGQILKVRGNPVITIQQGSIKNNTGADKTLAAGIIYTYTCMDRFNSWVENE